MPVEGAHSEAVVGGGGEVSDEGVVGGVGDRRADDAAVATPTARRVADGVADWPAVPRGRRHRLADRQACGVITQTNQRARTHARTHAEHRRY